MMFLFLLFSLFSASLGTSSENIPLPDYDCTQRILTPNRVHFTGSPPREIPPDLYNAYTRCGTIEVSNMYVDDSNQGLGTNYTYSKKSIEGMIDSSRRYTTIPGATAMGQRGWVQLAFAKYSNVLKGARVVLFGSQAPFYEAILLAHDVDHITVVEFNELHYLHPKISNMKFDEFASAMKNGDIAPFDVAVSISSFDHDGLGRYNDPLCPDGDLLSMDFVRDYALKPGGTMFLTVPLGRDKVIWNLMRIYATVRLPLLLEGYEKVDLVGTTFESILHKDERTWNDLKTIEPCFVLRTPKSDNKEEL